MSHPTFDSNQPDAVSRTTSPSPPPDIDRYQRPFDMGKPKNWFCDSRNAEPLSTKGHVEIELWYSADEPDLCWRYTAPIKDGMYCILDDDELRSVTRFPLIPFLIFNVCSAEFVGIPTFSHFAVRDDEYLILRNAKCSSRPQEVPTLWASVSDLLTQTRCQTRRQTRQRSAVSSPASPAATPVPMQLPTPVTSRSLRHPNPTTRRSTRVHGLGSSLSPPSLPDQTPTLSRVQRKRKRQSNQSGSQSRDD